MLKRLFRGTWDELPRLLAGTVLFCLGFYLAAGAVPGITPISLPALAIGVAPGAAVLLRAYLRIGADAGPAAPGSRTVRGVRAAVRVAAVLLVPTVAGSLYLVARFVAVDRGVWWLVPSMVICAAATVVALVLAVAALPSAAQDSWPGTGAALRSAVETVVRRPVPVIASLVLPAAAILVVSEVAATLLLFFPAPAALVVVAARLTTSLDAGRPALTLGSEGTTAP